MLLLRDVGRDANDVALQSDVCVLPIASRLIFCAAEMYRSSRAGDRSPTVTLSKP